jgi:hypothetical protein
MVIELMPHLPLPTPRQYVILRWLACNSKQPAIAKYAKCISRESYQGHIDGNDAVDH